LLPKLLFVTVAVVAEMVAVALFENCKKLFYYVACIIALTKRHKDLPFYFAVVDVVIFRKKDILNVVFFISSLLNIV